MAVPPLGADLDLGLQHLSPQELEVVTLRFGLNNQSCRSRDSVARQLGVPEPEVERLELLALRHLAEIRFEHATTH